MTKKSCYDITTFGEILIDFTWQGVNEDGQTLFAQNPGGAPANVAVAVASLCVERKGAIPAMPELAQVEERMGR